MSKSTTTTEEFDAEGNLVKRTVEVWEDDPEPIGNDGLTDAEREKYADSYRKGPGKKTIGGAYTGVDWNEYLNQRPYTHIYPVWV